MDPLGFDSRRIDPPLSPTCPAAGLLPRPLFWLVPSGSPSPGQPPPRLAPLGSRPLRRPKTDLENSRGSPARGAPTPARISARSGPALSVLSETDVLPGTLGSGPVPTPAAMASAPMKFPLAPIPSSSKTPWRAHRGGLLRCRPAPSLAPRPKLVGLKEPNATPNFLPDLLPTHAGLELASAPEKLPHQNFPQGPWWEWISGLTRRSA